MRKAVCIWLTQNCLFPQRWKNANNYIEKPIPNCYYPRNQWVISSLKGETQTTTTKHQQKQNRGRKLWLNEGKRERKRIKSVEAIKCSFPICAMCSTMFAEYTVVMFIYKQRSWITFYWHGDKREKNNKSTLNCLTIDDKSKHQQQLQQQTPLPPPPPAINQASDMFGPNEWETDRRCKQTRNKDRQQVKKREKMCNGKTSIVQIDTVAVTL